MCVNIKQYGEISPNRPCQSLINDLNHSDSEAPQSDCVHQSLYSNMDHFNILPTLVKIKQLKKKNKIMSLVPYHKLNHI